MVCCHKRRINSYSKHGIVYSSLRTLRYSVAHIMIFRDAWSCSFKRMLLCSFSARWQVFLKANTPYPLTFAMLASRSLYLLEPFKIPSASGYSRSSPLLAESLLCWIFIPMCQKIDVCKILQRWQAFLMGVLLDGLQSVHQCALCVLC